MIYKLFSQRQKEANSREPDVYQYDDVPRKLRVQIQQILKDAVGRYYRAGPYDMSSPYHNNDAWNLIKKTLCREMGVHALNHADNNREEVLEFLESCSTEQFLDVMDISCRYIERVIGSVPEYRLKEISVKQKPSEAIEEINYRLRQSSFGYQYESGELIRVDSQLVHNDVVKPVLRLLQHPAFAGAQAEFLTAHRLYREGDFPQAIVEAGKAFESTLKSTCKLKGWDFQPSDRAAELLKIVRKNGLLPEFLDKSFDQLQATLASALPQLRNNVGAHGQGVDIKRIPRELVEYALNLSAAKVLLVSKLALDQD